MASRQQENIQENIRQGGMPSGPAQRPTCHPPYGMEPYDLPGVIDKLGALSDTQQEELARYKGHLIEEDERYLRNHPEITCMIKHFMQEVLHYRPTDIERFATDYFTNPNLPQLLDGLLEEHASNKKINLTLMNSFLDY